MRELEFRAWIIKEKKMIYGIDLEADGAIFKDADAMENTFEYTKDQIEIMQYTGYKDCNKNKIFEADRITLYGRINAVSEENGTIKFQYGAWIIEFDNGLKLTLHKIRNNKIKIIGNTYEG